MKLNPVLERLTPYRAGPPLAAVQERYNLQRIARLSANESPVGPFPEVIEALKGALEGLNRYPDGWAADLRGVIAKQLNVPESCLVFGNGSCELLILLAEAFLGPDHHAVFPLPSFVMYEMTALANSAPYTAVAQPQLQYDVEALLAAVTEQTALLTVCNPNNPTGDYLEPRHLRSLLDRVPEQTVVVLDEAYGEFVTAAADEDTAPWIADYPNLVILRSFSKIYGLAGLRIGYGIARPEVIDALDKLRQPFNVGTLSQVAALESLRHPERMEERRAHVDSERRRLSAELAAMGVRVLPSQANFLLVNVEELVVPADQATQAMLEHGVMIRSGAAMGCPGWIRVSIGTVTENDHFLNALRELRGMES